jgi:septum formation inhibitor-activating ATPase MinD
MKHVKFLVFLSTNKNKNKNKNNKTKQNKIMYQMRVKFSFILCRKK